MCWRAAEIESEDSIVAELETSFSGFVLPLAKMQFGFCSTEEKREASDELTNGALVGLCYTLQ